MPECVAVKPVDGERAIRILREAGLLDRGFKPARGGGRLMLPVASTAEALEILRSSGLEAWPCSASFEPRRRPRGLRELGFEGLSGYSLVGDIAVFSRREGGPGVEEYRRAAEVLLREQPRVRAVYLKEATVGELRVQKLIHLAGERRTWTVHREFGLEFEVDIARAYFNPRLAGEHRRAAEAVGEGERVLDMFSGAGGSLYT
ncbi:hypothetical protein [Aeropyrum camini]|uniref:hypothetical protein n=1 Tax=Aeropyrum camini TaxID=229980 RepID=UPI0007871FDB|nr:hypothetical protein [Aeropyrum camini]